MLGTTTVLIAGYVGWAAWEPAPTFDAMRFHTNVGAAARRAAEADFRAHPPKGRKLTWRRFVDRLANPYQKRERPVVRVAIIPHTDGGRLLSISYPRRPEYLSPARDGVRWVRWGD